MDCMSLVMSCFNGFVCTLQFDAGPQRTGQTGSERLGGDCGECNFSSQH